MYIWLEQQLLQKAQSKLCGKQGLLLRRSNEHLLLSKYKLVGID
jgi:hypothetical protein